MTDKEVIIRHDRVNILSWNINNVEATKYQNIGKLLEEWNCHIVLIQEFGEWKDGDKAEQWEACLHNFRWHWNLQDMAEVWEEKIVEEYAEMWIQECSNVNEEG